MLAKIWQWYTRRFLKPSTTCCPTAMTSMEMSALSIPDLPEEDVVVVPEIRKAKLKREKRRIRNLDMKTRGAFGKAVIMRRERE